MSELVKHVIDMFNWETDEPGDSGYRLERYHFLSNIGLSCGDYYFFGMSKNNISVMFYPVGEGDADGEGLPGKNYEEIFNNYVKMLTEELKVAMPSSYDLEVSYEIKNAYMRLLDKSEIWDSDKELAERMRSMSKYLMPQFKVSAEGARLGELRYDQFEGNGHPYFVIPIKAALTDARALEVLEIIGEEIYGCKKGEVGVKPKPDEKRGGNNLESLEIQYEQLKRWRLSRS
jgi:hypothetical protein